jgi:type II restriction enzyme
MGFSDKAQRYFSDAELREAIKPVLDLITKRSGSDFRTEILYRFLLTRGDTLGGEMRNLTGESGPTKFIAAVVRTLKDHGIESVFFHGRTGEKKIKGIAWDQRVLFFDYKPKLIDKNVDVLLLRNPAAPDVRPECLEDKTLYLACGELKGGIDPAGADEHWKTAGSALARIRSRFGRRCPKLFFAASAIEQAMAKEIFAQLKTGELTHAANLTVEKQLEDLANWLVAL